MNCKHKESGNSLLLVNEAKALVRQDVDLEGKILPIFAIKTDISWVSTSAVPPRAKPGEVVQCGMEIRRRLTHRQG